MDRSTEQRSSRKPELPAAPKGLGGFGIANTITVIRVLLIPVFLVVMLTSWPALFTARGFFMVMRPWFAMLIFVALAATDAVDGHLARSRSEVTTFGKFIDPLADKILVTAALIGLVELRLLPGWITLIIITREFVISGLRMLASAEGVVIAASWQGKLKTVLQIVAISMFIVKDSALFSVLPPFVMTTFQTLAWIVMIAAVLMGIISMITYFKNSAEVLRGPLD